MDLCVLHCATQGARLDAQEGPHMCQCWAAKGWNFQALAAAAVAKSGQSCPILCDPIDGSPPGSSLPGILQARTLEWVAISFSNA